MAPRLGTPMLSTLHTPPFSWLESAIGATGGAGVRFAAVSRHTATAWSRVVDRVIVVPNGVDVDRWPVGPGGSYLVWSGRITPEKGPHLAVAAAGRSGRRLVLAGPIGNADYFRREIQPTSRRNGAPTRDISVRIDWRCWSAARRPPWLRRCGMSRTAWSSRRRWRAALPVVAFARGGIPEVVDAQCGRLVKPRTMWPPWRRRSLRSFAFRAPRSANAPITKCGARHHGGELSHDLSRSDRGTGWRKDDRLLRAPSRPRASRQSDQHLRTPA